MLMIEIIKDNRAGHKHLAFRSLFSPAYGDAFSIHG